MTSSNHCGNQENDFAPSTDIVRLFRYRFGRRCRGRSDVSFVRPTDKGLGRKRLHVDLNRRQRAQMVIIFRESIPRDSGVARLCIHCCKSFVNRYSLLKFGRTETKKQASTSVAVALVRIQCENEKKTGTNEMSIRNHRAARAARFAIEGCRCQGTAQAVHRHE